MKKVESILELKRLSDKIKCQPIECFIALRGNARSSKRISYDSEAEIFEILNEIDGTFQELNEMELFSLSNIGYAIKNGAFYQY
jgi:hypothetical protein